MGVLLGNSAKSVFRQTPLSSAPQAYALFSQDLQASGNIEQEKKKLALLQE